MATIREQIMQYLKGTTLIGTAGAGSRVFRSRADKFTPDESPAINLVPDNEQPNEDTIGKVNAMLHVEVQVYVRAASEADSVADAVIESVHSKIMADPQLGGLAFDISEDGTSWDFDEADRTALIVRMRYVVQYRHNRNNLSA